MRQMIDKMNIEIRTFRMKAGYKAYYKQRSIENMKVKKTKNV